MTKQKTFYVKGEKIKIISRLCTGLCVRTNINGQKFFSNYEIMHKEEGRDFHSLRIFMQKAMDIAYVKWVKIQKVS